MALSPTEVAQKRETKRMEQISALETQIDTALTQLTDNTPCVVDVSAQVAQSIVDEIVNRYRGAGWVVEVRVDFRGNRQLIFTMS